MNNLILKKTSLITIVLKFPSAQFTEGSLGTSLAGAARKSNGKPVCNHVSLTLSRSEAAKERLYASHDVVMMY